MLQEGEIVEMGSHDELLKLDGAYAQLERAQTQSDEFEVVAG